MKKIFSNKVLWVVAGILLIAAVLFFRSRSATNGQETTIVPKKDEVVSPKIMDIKEELTLSGSIDANKSNVQFQSSGLLSWVGVKEGDRVKKWQALASLDRRELQKSLERQFNNYRTELTQFDDTQDKYKEEKERLVLTDEMKRIMNRSQYSLDNAVIQYELADLAIKYATIYSPLNGIVTAIDQPVAGVHITPAAATFTIVDPLSVYFLSEVEQDDISKIEVGKKAAVELDSYPGEIIEGTIENISFAPLSGRSTPTYTVRIKIPVDNTDLKYRIGMDGDAIIAVAQSTEALTVPLDALIEEDDKTYLYVKKGDSNTAEKVEVKTGLETTTDVQIIEGITPNDQIVIKAD